MAAVSVVIPTRNRPDLIVRAVNSVVAQSLSDIEIIVVVDGDDGKTAAALDVVGDPRLRVFVLPENGGASAARNFGVSKATAPWIALLDDDDEMLPERLAIQLQAGEESEAEYPVILCRAFVQTPQERFVEPKILPGEGEHISEYFLNKKSLIGHVGGIGSSIIFTKKSLLTKVVFPEEKRHQDWAWVLKVNAAKGCKFAFVPDVLCIYHADHHVKGSTGAISTQNDWEFCPYWANRYRKYMTGRAYASYLLTTAAVIARRQDAWRAIPLLLRDAFEAGKPTLTHLILFLGVWLLPKNAQIAMRDLRHRIRPKVLWPRRQADSPDALSYSANRE